MLFHQRNTKNNSILGATNKSKTNGTHSINKFGTLSVHVLHFLKCSAQKLKKIGEETFTVEAETTHL